MFSGNVQWQITLDSWSGYNPGSPSRTRSVINDGAGHGYMCMAVNKDYFMAKIDFGTQTLTKLANVLLNNTDVPDNSYEWAPMISWNADKTKIIVLVPRASQSVYDIYEYVLANDTATLKLSSFTFQDSYHNYPDRIGHATWDRVLGKVVLASYQGFALYLLDPVAYTYAMLDVNIGTPGFSWPTTKYIHIPLSGFGPSTMGGVARKIRSMGYYPQFVAGIVIPDGDTIPDTTSPANANDVMLYYADTIAAFDNADGSVAHDNITPEDGRAVFSSYDGLWLKGTNGVATRFETASQNYKSDLHIYGESLLSIRQSIDLRYYL